MSTMKHGDFIGPARNKEEALSLAERCNKLIAGLDKADQFRAVPRLQLLGVSKRSTRTAASWGVWLKDLSLPNGKLPGQAEEADALTVHRAPPRLYPEDEAK